MKQKLKNHELCCVCGNGLDEDVQFHVPPPQIAFVYNKLMQVGMHSQAMVFMKVNKESFSGYCTKCWVYSYVQPAMEDPQTTDEQKKRLIDHHLTSTMENTSPGAIWNHLGHPDRN